MADKPLIDMRNVVKTYARGGETLRVLDGLDLAIKPGEFVAMMGPSGSGKTTILNMMGGLDRPETGTIEFDGYDINALSESERARWRAANVGFVFQAYNLVPVLRAIHNVELPLLLAPIKGSSRRERARTALEIVGLGDRMDHYPNQLSGGQEQRVAVARAIATDPALMLADEPTGDLDAASASEILDLFQRLNEERGQTIVMVTHDPKAAERAGRLVELGYGVVEKDSAA